MDDFREDYLQATTICIDNLCRNLVISSIYSPPRFSITENQYETFYKSLGPRFLAAGDYNAKHTFWGSRLITPKGRTLFNTISKLNLNVLSSGEPTYWPTDQNKIPDVIDFAVTKNLPVELIEVKSSLELSSDHSPIFVEILSPTNGSAVTSTRINWMKYKKFISTHCTEDISLRQPGDIDLALYNFTENLKLAVEHATQITKQNRYNKIHSADIEQLLAEKRRIRREWQRCRSPQLKAELRKCRKALNRLLNERKTASMNSWLENLDATSYSNYSLWRVTKRLKRPVISRPPLRKITGSWARNDTEKGNLFVSHLKKVFTPNECNSLIALPSIVPQTSMIQPIRFKIRDINKAIADLDSKKAPGFDRISNKMLLELPRIARRFILLICNAITRLGYYPSEWKVSLITMIPKPGKDHTKVESYRPISLLSNISKLFEKLIMLKLRPIMNRFDYIPCHQFGFREKHSTIEQTHRIVDVISRTFEERKFCSALFIDVSQAFDKVWHEGLLFKIKQHLSPNTHKLLESYLTHRKFILREGDFISLPQSIEAGVPQGSILGPFLYLIYTSDMPTNSRTYLSTFADDTAILSVHEDPRVASNSLQAHVRDLERWLKQWRIRVNEQKCIHVTFTLRRETCPPILINNQIIPQKAEVKYLGLHLDRRLTWKYHTDTKLTQIKLKLLQIYWLIGRNSRLSLDCKLLLYNSIIKPIWCYGIQLWGTASATNIEKIQRLQNKVLRTITAAPWYIKNNNIHKDLNVPVVKEVIKKHAGLYLKKLEVHPNPLARNILRSTGYSRLRRRNPRDLFRS